LWFKTLHQTCRNVKEEICGSTKRNWPSNTRKRHATASQCFRVYKINERTLVIRPIIGSQQLIIKKKASNSTVLWSIWIGSLYALKANVETCADLSVTGFPRTSDNLLFLSQSCPPKIILSTVFVCLCLNLFSSKQVKTLILINVSQNQFYNCLSNCYRPWKFRCCVENEHFKPVLFKQAGDVFAHHFCEINCEMVWDLAW